MSYICNIPYIIRIYLFLPLESIRTLTSWIWEVSDGRPTWIRATGLRILSFSNGWKIQQGDLGVWARKSSFTRLSALRNKKSCNLPVKCLTSDQLRDDMRCLLSFCWYSDERSQGSETAWLFAQRFKVAEIHIREPAKNSGPQGAQKYCWRATPHPGRWTHKA